MNSKANMQSKNVLGRSLGKNSRQYIDLLDRLNAFGLSNDIPTPKIVVIGDQSSGKSSTLENLSGVELPKGTGTVTKAALELQLRSPKQGDECGKELWINKNESEALPSTIPTYESRIKITDVAEAVDSMTKILTRTTKFTKHVIVVRIVEKGLQDLTLVDLPGIIRVQGGGGEKQMVDDLIKHYVTQKDVIMLPVVPCTADLDTSACLEMARLHDPTGKRTFVALTKADLIDKGGEGQFVEVLTKGYAKCPRIMGWVMVKNRSQSEINEKVALSKIQEDEMNFFQTTEPWSQVKNPKDHFGVRTLAQKLSDLQVKTIKEFLPNIKERIESKLKETKTQLQSCPKVVPDNPVAKLQIAMDMILDFSTEAKRILSENNIDEGSNLWQQVHLEFAKLRETIKGSKTKFEEEDYLQELEKKCDAFRGPQLPLFPSYELVRHEISEVIATWKEPSMNTIETLKSMIEALLLELVKQKFGNFPPLANKVNETLLETLRERFEKIESDIHDQLKITASTPYTQNDYYEKTVVANLLEKLTLDTNEQLKSHFADGSSYYGKAIISTMEALNKQVKDRVMGSLQAIMLSSAIKAYLQVCYKRFCDNVPNLVLLHFMEKFSDEISSKLTGLLSQNHENIDELIEMDAGMADLRARLVESEKRLSKCLETVNKSMV